MGEQSFVRHGPHRGPAAGRLADGLVHALEHARVADDLARAPGLLQGLDPRVKLAGLLALIVAAVSVHALVLLAAMLLLAAGLAVASSVPLPRLGQVWLAILAFTGIIALPALVLVPGEALLRLPGLGWTVTVPGLRSAAFLVLRSTTAATLGLLLVLTTPWPHLLKAMRAVRVPVVLVMVLGMTHRYIFVLLDLGADLLEARRSRLVGRLSPRDTRRLATATAGALLVRAVDMSGDIYLAMLSRGYRGEPRTLDAVRLRPRDGVALAAVVALLAALWVASVGLALP